MDSLEGIKTKLRAIEPEDVDIIYQWENDLKIWHLSNTVTPFSRFAIEQYIFNSGDIYSSKQLRLIIEVDNEAAGCIDLFDFDPNNRRAGIGIFINKNFRNNGYAKDALNTLVDYCFKILNLHQLYCSILSDNTESLNLFKSKGFEITGTRKQWIYHNNKWLDELFLQLINQ